MTEITIHIPDLLAKAMALAFGMWCASQTVTIVCKVIACILTRRIKKDLSELEDEA